MGRDDGGRRGLRRLEELPPLREGGPGADRLQARHPHPPGPGGREDPFFHLRRRGQDHPQQHPLRHHARQRRAERRHGAGPARPGRAQAGARQGLQGRHEPGGVSAAAEKRGAGENPAGHAHGHQQLLRRPARVDGQHPPGLGAQPRLRHPVFPGRLPLRRERLVHQDPRTRPPCPVGARARPGDVLPRRRVHHERQEGRAGEHRRVFGAQRRRAGAPGAPDPGGHGGLSRHTAASPAATWRRLPSVWRRCSARTT